MTTESQTPRTDALSQACRCKRDAAVRWDMEDLARTLERDNALLREALTGAVEALEYARDHGLDNPTINGHKVLALRLYDARATLVQS